MGNFVYLVALFGLFTTGLTFPLDDEPVRGHRDSTKAILSLEQELKQSAGEDKQFAPPDDSAALVQLAAEGQKLQQAQDQAQDQAALDELSALQNEAPGGLTLEQMHALENEPVADVDEEDLESLVGEPGEEEEMEDDGHNTDTFKEKIGIQSDKKSPYKVVAVSEKKSSDPAFDLPDVPPQVDMEYPTQPQEYRNAQIEDDDDDDSFMTHFQSVVEKYPELMQFMNDPAAMEQYQRMVLAQPDYLDREEAMQAEMLAAQQPGIEGDDYTDVRPAPQDAYVDYGTAAQHGPAQGYNNEREQQFAGEKIAHAVAAKKYLEWMKASQHEAAVPGQEIQVHTRAAELMEQLPQQLYEEDVHMAM